MSSPGKPLGSGIEMLLRMLQPSLLLLETTAACLVPAACGARHRCPWLSTSGCCVSGGGFSGGVKRDVVNSRGGVASTWRMPSHCASGMSSSEPSSWVTDITAL